MAVFITIFFVLWATVAATALIREGVFLPILGGFLLCGLVAMLFMAAIFAVARYIGRYDLVDAAWGAVFIVIALTSFVLGGAGGGGAIDLLVTSLVIIWGSRLAIHIGKRIKHTDQEDPRYVELRKKWKGNQQLNIFLRIYMVQALLALFISVPVIIINLFNSGTRQWAEFFSSLGYRSINGVIDLLLFTALLGLAVWALGFIIETIADRQLRTFIAEPKNKGKLMTTGLWRYSRHPNYFGELTQWWGIFIICLTTSFGVLGIIGPVLITYLILYVSGIPLNEKRYEGRPGWAEYKARTSVLVPLPPRS